MLINHYRWMRRLFPIAVLTLFVAQALTRGLFASPPAPTGLETPIALGPGENVITIVGTNDIHGGMVPAGSGDDRQGGMAWLAGYVEAVRAHMDRTYAERGQVLVLDAGDAAQGTLLSNFSEGQLLVSLMNKIGYTAGIPGNHAYDFGPVGWEYDRVFPGLTQDDPRGALKAFIHAASFPILGANVTTKDGKNLPELPPYTLVPSFGGRNIAVIGLDHPLTAHLTVPENVADLTFGNGVDELTKIVGALRDAGKADAFILVIHMGDGSSRELGEFLEKLPRRSDGQPLIDAVVAGHTHTINDAAAAGIPYVQSGANGQMFGLMQLVVKVDPATHRLVVEHNRERQKAGIPIACQDGQFLGEPVREDARVADLLTEGQARVATIASQVLGTAKGALTKAGGRIADCTLGNFLADGMRQAAGTEIALINEGDVRADLPAGTIRFVDLFAVAPKNLMLVTVPALPVKLLVKNMQRSTSSCGRRGALQISGLTVEYSRDCAAPTDGEDPGARLLKLTTSSGRVLYARKDDTEVFDPKPVSMATTDFVLSGGAGYTYFRGVPTDGPGKPLRAVIADWIRTQGMIDPAAFATGRYHNQAGQ